MSKASNKHPFIEAIRVEHEDDAPRLIYADWLEENGGDPLEAARIRLTTEKRRIERALRTLEITCGRESDRVIGMRMKYGLDDIVAKHTDVSALVTTDDGYYPFEGEASAFVEGIRGKASAIKRAFMSSLLEREPIHYVCITEMDDPSVFNSKAWMKITALAYKPHEDLAGEQQQAGAEVILEHLPHLTHLQSLGGSFPVQPVIELLTRSSFPHLKNLSISYWSDREVVERLIEATQRSIRYHTALPLPALESMHSIPLGENEWAGKAECEQVGLAKDLLRLQAQARSLGLDKAERSTESEVAAEESSSPRNHVGSRNPRERRTDNPRINPAGTEPDTGPSRG